MNQDAANNVYLLRLADMYLTYVEAVMATESSTSDPAALNCFNAVRRRAHQSEVSQISYSDLMKERLRELAFESQSWFDTQRLRYREGNEAALDWLNTGFNTGYNRCSQYNLIYGTPVSEENDPSSYVIATTKEEYSMYDPIMLNAESFICPIPAAVSSSSPAMTLEPVDFYNK